MMEHLHPKSVQGSVMHWTVLSMNPEDGTMDDFVPGFANVALEAAHQGWDPDTPSHNEALSGPHTEEFEKAMLHWT